MPNGTGSGGIIQTLVGRTCCQTFLIFTQNYIRYMADKSSWQFILILDILYEQLMNKFGWH
jgi:hypothetical protein